MKIRSAVALSLLVLATPALAAPAVGSLQGPDATGAVGGRVLDAAGAPIAGVQVRLEGVGLIQGETATESGESGAYRFRGLRPGEYVVGVRPVGFQPLEYRVRVSVGVTARVDLQLQPLGLEETEVVSLPAPLIDPGSAEVTHTFTAELIANAPLAREFIEVPELAPGVTDRGAYGAGADASGRYRQGSVSNAYTLNGVDVTEPSSGVTWINPGIDTIAEIQVVGIGARAEHGNFTGATVNLVTKSGTNRLAGALGYYFRGSGLRANNAGGNEDFERGRLKYNHEVSASLGGPLLRERLLFFVNAGLELDSEAAYGSEVFRDLNHRRYNARLDALLDEHNTVGLMLNSTPSRDRNLGLWTGAPREIGFGVDFGTVTWLANWQSQQGENTYLDARYSGYTGSNRDIPNSDAPGLWDYSTGNIYGASIWQFEEDNGRHAAEVTVSHYADEFLGTQHDFKFGIEYDRTWSDSTLQYTGGSWVGMYPAYGYTYLYGYTFSEHVDATVKRATVYLQDDVQVSDRVALNLGVRYDDAGIDDAYDGPGGRPGQRASYEFLAPRLGLSVDLTGEARYVARASWGRYYEKALSWATSSAGGYGDAPWRLYGTVVAGEIDPASTDTRELADLVVRPENLWASYPATSVPVDPGLTGPRTDVLDVGLQAQLSHDYVLSLDFVHKRDANFVIFQDRQPHAYEPFEYTDPLGGTQTLYARTDDNPPDFWITNSDSYHRRHDLVMLSLRRRASDSLDVAASVTYQRSTGNLDNDRWSAWTRGTGRGFGSLSPNGSGHPYSEGRVGFNREWQLKALASYRFPGGILASGYFRWMSGRPWTPTIRARALNRTINEAFFLGDVRLEPRGSRTAPALSQLDLRLAKSFDLGGRQTGRLEVMVDVFNALNSASPTGVYSQWGSRYFLSGEPSFGLPSGVIAPRQAQLGARLTF